MNDSWFELLDALPDDRCRRSLERLLDREAIVHGHWRYVRTPTFTSADYIVVDTGHVVAWEGDLRYAIRRAGGLKSTLFSGEGLVLEFTGQGTVWLQTRNLGAFLSWITPFLP